MKQKSLRRLLALIGIVFSCLWFSTSHYYKKVISDNEHRPLDKFGCDEKAVQGGSMIWESLSRHLLSINP